MSQQLSVLEHHVALSAPVSWLGRQSVYPLPYPSLSKLGTVESQVSHLFQDHRDLHAYIGHDTVDLESVKFESFPQTID